jgi:glycolate oxidase FAD binding subunit
MIGSFGTLAAMAVINFKLTPIPPVSRTFVLPFVTVQAAVARRDQILGSVLQPVAIDILTAPAAAQVGLEGCSLVLHAAGNSAVIGRYASELDGARVLEGDAEDALWTKIREYLPAFIARQPGGVVARVSSTLNQLSAILDAAPGEAIARAGTGVTYVYLPDSDAAARWTSVARSRGWRYALEYSAGDLDRWPDPGTDFAMMIKVKEMFDPQGLLNRGRLYGRI